MATFIIPVTYQMAGEYHVEADTLEQAKEKVLDADPPYDALPKNAEYVDDSMEVNEEVLAELNSSEEDEENGQ